MGYKKPIKDNINKIMNTFEKVAGTFSSTTRHSVIVNIVSSTLNATLHYADKKFIIVNILDKTGETWNMYRVFFNADDCSNYKIVYYFDRSMRNKRKTVYDNGKEIYYDYENNHSIKVIEFSGNKKSIIYKDHYNIHYSIVVKEDGKVGISLTGGPMYEDLGKFIYKASKNKDLIKKFFKDFSEANKN